MSAKDKGSRAQSLLTHVPLFAGLDAGDIDEVLSMMTPLIVERGTLLASQGDNGNEFMIIVEGTATVLRDGKVVAHVGPGDFQGEISLLDGGPRTATVVADSSMELLVASRNEFTGLLDAKPAIARAMLPALARRIRSASPDHPQH